MNLVGTTVYFAAALLLNVASPVFDRVSQNVRKVLRLGFEGVSMAVLDASGFGSGLIQRVY